MAAGDKTLTGNIRLLFDLLATEEGATSDIINSVPFIDRWVKSPSTTAGDIATGTGSYQAERICYSAGTLTATSTSIDLTADTDIFGDSCAFTKLKVIAILNESTTTTENLTYGNDSSHVLAGIGTATHSIIIPPNSFWVMTNMIDGWTVTNSTADVVKIDSGSDTISYRCIRIGLD